MQLSLNLNDTVSVTLNIHGVSILHKYYNTDPITEKQIVPILNIKDIPGLNDTIYKTELWNLMQIFGKYMYNGCTVPFALNEMRIN